MLARYNGVKHFSKRDCLVYSAPLTTTEPTWKGELSFPSAYRFARWDSSVLRAVHHSSGRIEERDTNSVVQSRLYPSDAFVADDV